MVRDTLQWIELKVGELIIRNVPNREKSRRGVEITIALIRPRPLLAAPSPPAFVKMNYFKFAQLDAYIEK